LKNSVENDDTIIHFNISINMYQFLFRTNSRIIFNIAVTSYNPVRGREELPDISFQGFRIFPPYTVLSIKYTF